VRNVLGLLALAALGAAPIGAQAATGMAAMQYYVGTWTCTGGMTGQAPAKATLTNTLDSGVMRQWIVVPPQGKMKMQYTLSVAVTYDAKNGRYVQTGLDNQAGWWVSYAKPFTGNTEQWADHMNNTGKLGRSEVMRSDQNSYVYTGYDTMAATKPNFKTACRRSM